MIKEPEVKTSVSKFLIFIIVGILITGYSLHIIIQYHITDTITFYIGDMAVHSVGAVISTTSFLIVGILFLIHGIHEFHELTHASKYIKMVPIILLTIIIGLTLYFAIEYYKFIAEDLKYANFLDYYIYKV